MNVVGFEEILVDDTVKFMDPGKYEPASLMILTGDLCADPGAFITVERPVRFRADGGDPTISIGELLYDNDKLIIKDLTSLRNFRFIADQGVADGKLMITYFDGKMESEFY